MFDLLVLIVLVISGGVGFLRGGVRELVAVASFLVAVLVAILTLKFTAPVAMATINTEWLAKALAMLAVFLVVYVVLRLAGGALAKGVHATPLGALDRVVGLGFGLIRGLILVGLFNIVFRAAVPEGQMPEWITEAKTYPLASVSADALQALAPKGASMAHKVTPALKQAIDGSGEASPDERRDKAGK